MKKKKITLAFFLPILCLLLSACTADCYCDKDLGCTILTVKKRNGPNANTVLSTKVFCSTIDYHSDVALIDSVNAFEKRFTTDSSFVEKRDSIYKHYDQLKVRRNLDKYRDSGYFCNCPR